MQARNEKKSHPLISLFFCRLKTWLWLLCRMHRLSFSLFFHIPSHLITSVLLCAGNIANIDETQQHTHTFATHRPFHFTNRSKRWNDEMTKWSTNREKKTHYYSNQNIEFFSRSSSWTRDFSTEKNVNENKKTQWWPNTFPYIGWYFRQQPNLQVKFSVKIPSEYSVRLLLNMENRNSSQPTDGMLKMNAKKTE